MFTLRISPRIHGTVMATQGHGSRVRILYDSNDSATVERLVQEVAQAGFQPDLFDLRYSARASDICSAVGDELICVVDESVNELKRNLLVGYAMGANRPLVLPSGDSSNSPVPLLENIVTVPYDSVGERVAWIQANRHSMAARMQVELFSNIDTDEPVAVVCAEIPEELRPSYAIPTYRDFLRYATFADVDALIELMVWFSASKQRTVEAYTSNSLPDSLFAKHILVVGGPAWNRLAKTLYRTLPLPLEHRDGGPGNPDPIVDRTTGEVWLPEVASDGEILSDVGFSAQLPSPFHPDRTLTIFGGVLTHGVEASVKIFTSASVGARNWEIIKSLRAPPATGFLVAFRTKVVANNNVSPDLTQPGVLLAAYSCRAGEFYRVET